MKKYNLENLFLLTDLYELTMAQGYFYYEKDVEAVFDLTFRKTPFNSSFIIFAGLETLIDIILSLKATKEDIEYLRSLGLFKEEFLNYISNFKFTGDIYSVEEGEVVFPKEPILRVHAPIIQAQVLESLILNTINFQSLIATKTARIVEVAKDKSVFEFGLRRAQGIDGSISASRAAYIGGAAGSSNVLASKLYGIPVKGTMAHSWVMSFENEYKAFEKFAKIYPNNCILLIDTYNTLKSGVKNAIKVFKRLKEKGFKNFGVRLDSGDLETLSKQVRKILDQNGLKEVKIVVSNELDEYIIEQLVSRGTPIDIFGVGTKLITGYPDASLSGVYKIVAKKNNDKYSPVLKISDMPEKVSLPHIKNVTRFYNEKRFLYDLIYLETEKVNVETKCFHPDFHYNIKNLIEKNCKKKVLLKPIVLNGKLVYKFPLLEEVRKNTKNNLNNLQQEYKRLINPHIYTVAISEKLKKTKEKLIQNNRGGY